MNFEFKQLMSNLDMLKRSISRAEWMFFQHFSLNVACLKRLVPVGLGFFSGREQELLQQAKQKLLQVRSSVCVDAKFSLFFCLSFCFNCVSKAYLEIRLKMNAIPTEKEQSS